MWDSYKCTLYLPCELYPFIKTKILTRRHDVIFALPSDIRDPLIRSFAKNNPHPFWALKSYVTQTEDRELDAKVNIVEKYRSRIPELVKRLERCFESDFNKAGMQKKKKKRNLKLIASIMAKVFVLQGEKTKILTHTAQRWQTSKMKS